MPRKFKITNAGSSSDSPDLVGCHIEETNDGGAKLVAVLATSSTQTPPYSFSFDGYKGWNWTVTVTSVSPSAMSGTWSNNDPNNASITGEEDSWTATGAGAGESEDDEAQAASAK